MSLNNKVYDYLKWIALIGLPASATLYYAIANIWGLPNTEQILGTVVAINTFLGTVIGVSTYEYNKNLNK